MFLRSTGKKRVALVCVALAVVAVVAYATWEWHQTQLAKTFFSQQLSSAGITVPASASLSSLELLYAQAAAERSPVFGIDGTDPSALASAVSALATTSQNIAAAQSNAQDAQLAQTLYPIDFLRSLASTEAARQAFIADGSSANEGAYDAALRTTAIAGGKDAQAFQAALRSELGTTTFMLGTTDRPIETGLMLQSASDIVARMSALGQEIARRDTCISGTTASCNAADIALPQVAPATLPPSSEPLPQLPSEVLATLSSALPQGFFSGASIVRLDSSVCLDGFPAPFYFAVRPSPDLPQTKYLYINDMFFLPTPSGSGATSVDSFTNVYHISYLYSDPLEFYQCPEVAADIAHVDAILHTAAFAATHPTLAPTDAQVLQGPVADEGYARAYIAGALTSAGDQSDQQALIGLALEFNEGNADLSTLVGEIASLDQFNLNVERQGLLPGGSDIRTLYLTHSAFPSLFLASNASSTPSVSSIRNTDPTYFTGTQSPDLFSNLRNSLPNSEIVRNLTAEYDFENGAAQ